MKKNNKVLINFYEINECGHIFYVQWDESSTEIERGNVIVYEIVEKELRAITTPRFAREVLSGKRHFGVYNVDRTTIAIVGRNCFEFGSEYNAMCDIGHEIFSLDDCTKWGESGYLEFQLDRDGTR